MTPAAAALQPRFPGSWLNRRPCIFHLADLGKCLDLNESACMDASQDLEAKSDSA
jgi:hypothetical protein